MGAVGWTDNASRPAARRQRYQRADKNASPPSISPWLPDGYSQIFRSYVFGPSGFWTMAPLRCAAKFDPFLSLDCAPRPPPWRNPRKGRDQILPSGSTGSHLSVAASLSFVKRAPPVRPSPHSSPRTFLGVSYRNCTERDGQKGGP